MTNQRNLTIKQRKFALALPLAHSATEAARIAGYSPIVASELASENLRKPHVAAAIAEQQAKIERASIATLVERKEKLTELLRTPTNPEHVTPQIVIAASDQLNRMESVYVERSVALTANVDAELEGFTVEELQALLVAMRPGDEKLASAPVADAPKALRGRRKA